MQIYSADEQTICALATPAGAGAISVVRISGARSLEIILLACPGLAVKNIQSHRTYLTKFKGKSSQVIDEVLVTYFENLKSYTGECSIEISCHGNPLIVEKILNRLHQLGARAAGRGEFTYRAFMNDKIDLVQAEAVLSVIQAESDRALKVSLRQLEGQTSKRFLDIESELTWCLAHIEASIDFSTEGLDVVDGQILIEKIKAILVQLEKMIEGYSSGKILKDGLKIVFLGLPNVGKSSLMNQVVEKDKAIVTSIAGTTRDVIEAATTYKGLKILVSDTAGIRDTNDLVEKIGVEKSLLESAGADLSIYVFDATTGLTTEDEKLVTQISKQKTLFIANKADRVTCEQQTALALETTKKLQKLLGPGAPGLELGEKSILFVSALDQACRDQLLMRATGEFKNLDFLNESIISSARQLEMSLDAATAIKQVVAELQQMTGSEFVAQTLKGALLSIQKILGHSFDDQIMDRIFKEFCLGK
jgi:tRNA modification GTPase